MNIISQFNNFLNENFNKFLEKYFNNSNFWYKSSSIDNYFNFMNDIDDFSTTFISNCIKAYFEYIDNAFFNSKYRKQFCISNGFYERTILTLFGQITFKRRYYFDKNDNERFFFTDLFLGLPKRKYYDPFIRSEICNEAASSNYSKTGKIIASKIGKRINNNIFISRATSRNIVMNFNIEENNECNLKRVNKLFVMLDEKFVGSQFNDGNDHMIKASIVFEDRKLVYKYKKKEDSKDRYKLINSHTCASIDNDLLTQTVDYIYNNYDVDYLKEIYFMGDCASWIKSFPKSYWFKFNKDSKVYFAMDGFHFSQALKNLTTNKYPEVYEALMYYVNINDKKEFKTLCNDFMDLCPDRKEVITSKMNYILNNWNERQLYKNKSYLKCSMESHISHIFADIFTSRPKAYSKKGLRKLLQLRLLKINGENIRENYFNSLRPKEKLTYTNSKLNKEINNYKNYDFNRKINFLNYYSTINFI